MVGFGLDFLVIELCKKKIPGLGLVLILDSSVTMGVQAMPR